MDDEAAFLAAMRAAPAARLTRHVYADWLEERGDPRHELVRVCEAMRAVPVWSDDYWQWKARRNELWTRFPIEWLEATGYDGSDYDPIFRDGVPDGVRERWRLIREFTERWHGVSVPDVGGRRDVIAREEARLGLTLPESVRELIAFTHDVGVKGTGGTASDALPASLSYVAEYRSRSRTVDLFDNPPGRGVYFASAADLDVADILIQHSGDSLRYDHTQVPRVTTRWIFWMLASHVFRQLWSVPCLPAERLTDLNRLCEAFGVPFYRGISPSAAPAGESRA